MGQTALLPLRRKACWGFFFALKNPTASVGFEPANFGTKGQHATSRPQKQHVQSLLGPLWTFSLRSASSIDEVLFMVKKQKFDLWNYSSSTRLSGFGNYQMFDESNFIILSYQAMSEAEFCFVQIQTYLFRSESVWRLENMIPMANSFDVANYVCWEYIYIYRQSGVHKILVWPYLFELFGWKCVRI